MINHNMAAALAGERRNTLLAEAEAARLAQQARSHRRASASAVNRSRHRWVPAWLRTGGSRRQIRLITQPALEGDDIGTHRPSERQKRVRLNDGSKVLIRPVRSADAPLLVDGFKRLSAESRRLRFLSPKDRLSQAEIRYFTEVDHHDHEALTAIDLSDGRGVGIARYVRDVTDPAAAEIAVTVADEWQGRGLGTELLAKLAARALEEGVRRFTATASTDNAAVVGLLRNMNADVDCVGHEFDTLEYEITLAPRASAA